jgi:hypothetical protein
MLLVSVPALAFAQWLMMEQRLNGWKRRWDGLWAADTLVIVNKEERGVDGGGGV